MNILKISLESQMLAKLLCQLFPEISLDYAYQPIVEVVNGAADEHIGLSISYQHLTIGHYTNTG